MPGMAVVLAIDAGTTGVRTLAVDEAANVVCYAYRELTQHFPRPGLVEHDAGEIFSLVEETLAEVAASLAEAGEPVAAVGITNQRETAVAWDRASGRPLGPAIVWQDRRTAERCRQLDKEGHLATVRAATGLVLDGYFSATKWEWMLGHGLERPSGLALGTVDDWLCWKLTGRHATDVTNASRTLLFDLRRREWSDELCALFGLERAWLGEVVPSSGRIGRIGHDLAGGRLAGVPLSAMAGDQQAALFGQGCFERGATKVTYGTGSFILMNLGPALPVPAEGLLTTVAWQLGDGASEVVYALEGAVFASGATLPWLRDGLGIVSEAAEVGPLAAALESNEGVYLVPAFTGLGSPWWDPEARAAVVGLTRGVGRAHLARAAVEAMAYQTRDVVQAMAEGAGCEVSILRADGGAAVMDLLLQLQADQLRVPVVRASTTEVTALGAAMLAGVAEGVWSRDDLSGLVREAARFKPVATASRADADHRGWLEALARARGFGAVPRGGGAEGGGAAEGGGPGGDPAS